MNQCQLKRENEKFSFRQKCKTCRHILCLERFLLQFFSPLFLCCCKKSWKNFCWRLLFDGEIIGEKHVDLKWKRNEERKWSVKDKAARKLLLSKVM